MVYLLGDNESGKTTLIAKLQGVEDPKKGSGLEFAYIDVRDDYRDGLYKIKEFLFINWCNISQQIVQDMASLQITRDYRYGFWMETRVTQIYWDLLWTKRGFHTRLSC